MTSQRCISTCFCSCSFWLASLSLEKSCSCGFLFNQFMSENTMRLRCSPVLPMSPGALHCFWGGLNTACHRFVNIYYFPIVARDTRSYFNSWSVTSASCLSTFFFISLQCSACCLIMSDTAHRPTMNNMNNHNMNNIYSMQSRTLHDVYTATNARLHCDECLFINFAHSVSRASDFVCFVVRLFCMSFQL